MNKVYILSAVRTPIGSFMGELSGVSATYLGSVAIREATIRAQISELWVQEVIMGNVYSAHLGQAPARQAALGAGLAESTICTTLNKVCASGMKAVMWAAQIIQLGHQDVVVAGGMESMSNVPYYSDKLRGGNKLNHVQLWDGLIKDGLWDVYNNFHMGNAVELTVKKLNISRERQDAYTAQSYQRAAKAWQNGWFKNEVCAVQIPDRIAPRLVTEDEEYKKVNYEKISQLKPVFESEGTLTAANSSTINDGASALVLASEAFVNKHGLKPLAEILSFADAAQAPADFATTPALAIPRALHKIGLEVKDIGLFEINEAFAAVTIANMQILNVHESQCNIQGGAVSIGHPLGCSGARIITTLVHQLHTHSITYGVAGICNGGGGGSAIVVKKI